MVAAKVPRLTAIQADLHYVRLTESDVIGATAKGGWQPWLDDRYRSQGFLCRTL
jgi:hypothetical protein